VPPVSPQAFPLPSLPRRQPTLLVACGPAQTGAIGLVCARHLRSFVGTSPPPPPPPPPPGLPPSPFSPQDYEPTIFYPKRSPDPLHRDFTTQCERMDIPFLSYLPTEVTPVPASPSFFLLSFPFSPPRLPKSPPDEFLSLFPSRSPLPAPSRRCRDPGDARKSSGRCLQPPALGDIRPAVLVSLAAPKAAARRFQGQRHFLAGRFVPEELRRKFGIRAPPYPGSDCVVALGPPG
ncbi:YJEN3 protein, partial [Hirundo rustica]|nr:YJEN3 protein [Hirundo rustica]